MLENLYSNSSLTLVCISSWIHSLPSPSFIPTFFIHFWVKVFKVLLYSTLLQPQIEDTVIYFVVKIDDHLVEIVHLLQDVVTQTPSNVQWRLTSSRAGELGDEVVIQNFMSGGVHPRSSPSHTWPNNINFHQSFLIYKKLLLPTKLTDITTKSSQFNEAKFCH